MRRKDFLKKTTIAICSISAFGMVKKGEDGFVGDCDTTNDILGPFYRAEAPLRQDLTYAGLSGSVITLQGTVYGADCVTPLPNALVEIWHCNTEGEYDNDSSAFRQRGKWYSDQNGKYSFKTILPGKYLNGQLYRPAHIHFRITEKNSRELVSQLYFQGDPHIEKDPWASQEKATRRILPIALEDTQGNLAVTFDIYLGAV